MQSLFPAITTLIQQFTGGFRLENKGENHKVWEENSNSLLFLYKKVRKALRREFNVSVYKIRIPKPTALPKHQHKLSHLEINPENKRYARTTQRKL